MNCARVQTKSMEFLDGDLTLPEHLQVESHIASCSTCSEEIGEWRTLWDACAGAVVHPEPENRFHELRHEIVEPLEVEVSARNSLKRRRSEILNRWAVVFVTGLVIAAVQPLKSGLDHIIGPWLEPAFYENTFEPLPDDAAANPWLHQRLRILEEYAESALLMPQPAAAEPAVPVADADGVPVGTESLPHSRRA